MLLTLKVTLQMDECRSMTFDLHTTYECVFAIQCGTREEIQKNPKMNVREKHSASTILIFS